MSGNRIQPVGNEGFLMPDGSRILPDSTGGYILPDGSRLTPDTTGGYVPIPSSVGLNGGESLIAMFFMAIGIPILIVAFPALTSWFVLVMILASMTGVTLGRPLTAEEVNVISSQAALMTIVFWAVVALMIGIWRSQKKK